MMHILNSNIPLSLQCVCFDYMSVIVIQLVYIKHSYAIFGLILVYVFRYVWHGSCGPSSLTFSYMRLTGESQNKPCQSSARHVWPSHPVRNLPRT